MIQKLRYFRNYFNFSENKGLAQIPLLLGLLLMAIAVPVATQLVKQNQDTRNKAAYDCSTVVKPNWGCTIGGVSYDWTCNTQSNVYECIIPKPTATTIPTYNPLSPVPVACTQLTCLSGQVKINQTSTTCICAYPTATPTKVPTAVPTVNLTACSSSNVGVAKCVDNVLNRCAYNVQNNSYSWDTTDCTVRNSYCDAGAKLCQTTPPANSCYCDISSRRWSGSCGSTVLGQICSTLPITPVATATPVNVCGGIASVCTGKKVGDSCNLIGTCHAGSGGIISGCDCKIGAAATLTPIPTLKSGVCTTLTCPTPQVKMQSGSYPYTDCYCSLPAATLTPTKVPTATPTLRMVGCSCLGGHLVGSCLDAGAFCPANFPTATPTKVSTPIPTLKSGVCTTLTCPTPQVKMQSGSYPYTDCYCSLPAATLTPTKVSTPIPTLKSGVCTTLTCPTPQVKMQSGSYPYTDCYCSLPAATLTPTKVPTATPTRVLTATPTLNGTCTGQCINYASTCFNVGLNPASGTCAGGNGICCSRPGIGISITPTRIPTYNPTNPVPKTCLDLTCLPGQVKVNQTSTTCICAWPTATPTMPRCIDGGGQCINYASSCVNVGLSPLAGSCSGQVGSVYDGICCTKPNGPTATLPTIVYGCDPNRRIYCVGNVVRVCRADGSGYDQSPCVSGTVCDSTGTRCVVPGSPTFTPAPTARPTSTPTLAPTPTSGGFCLLGLIGNCPTSTPTARPTAGGGNNTPTTVPPTTVVGRSTPTSVNQPTATTAPGMCTMCPNDFKCYVNNGSYKWFSSAFQGNGYVLATGAEATSCGGVAKPPFLNKAKGDANCDGMVDIDDRSLWTKEYTTDKGAETTSKVWLSDFDCDSKVTIYDRSIWTQNFIQLNSSSAN